MAMNEFLLLKMMMTITTETVIYQEYEINI